ncbi:MAG TPA: hypothetical protein VGD56_05230 [Gemmatirosa sp.]
MSDDPITPPAAPRDADTTTDGATNDATDGATEDATNAASRDPMAPPRRGGSREPGAPLPPDPPQR